MSLRLLFVLAALLGSAPEVSAQRVETPNGVFLVATPALLDPNFRHSVVLVTQTPDGGTVGFIVNRPGGRSLAQILPDNEVMKHFTESLYLGGPVEGAALLGRHRRPRARRSAMARTSVKYRRVSGGLPVVRLPRKCGYRAVGDQPQHNFRSREPSVQASAGRASSNKAGAHAGGA